MGKGEKKKGRETYLIFSVESYHTSFVGTHYGLTCFDDAGGSFCL